MEEDQTYINPYKHMFDETKELSIWKLLLGLAVSTVILLASTWGLLSLLTFAGAFSFDSSNFIPYTIVMLVIFVGSIILALILCAILIKWPRTVSLPLWIHRRAKHHSGDYFMSPEPEDENLRDAFRRSLYGSVLVVGIALTILGFDLMTSVTTEGLIYIGTILMVVSVVILPFTVMLLYYGPWLMKEAGLFHLDKKDRCLSNVGDDVEDILEFFAGVDIILVWIELALSVGFEAPWVPVFVIIIAIGPLFSIMLNFTIIFVFVKKRATVSMMRYLSDRFHVPDMATSPGYIRNQVLSLVEHQFIMTAPAPSVDPVMPGGEDAMQETKDSGLPPPSSE